MQEAYAKIQKKNLSENTLELPIRAVSDIHDQGENEPLEPDGGDKKEHTPNDLFNKKSRKNLGRFMKYSLKNKGLLVMGNLALLMSSASQIVLPYLTGKMVDVISGSKSSDELR